MDTHTRAIRPSSTICRKSLFITITIETKHFVISIKDDHRSNNKFMDEPKKIIIYETETNSLLLYYTYTTKHSLRYGKKMF